MLQVCTLDSLVGQAAAAAAKKPAAAAKKPAAPAPQTLTLVPNCPPSYLLLPLLPPRAQAKMRHTHHLIHTTSHPHPQPNQPRSNPAAAQPSSPLPLLTQPIARPQTVPNPAARLFTMPTAMPTAMPSCLSSRADRLGGRSTCSSNSRRRGCQRQGGQVRGV